MPANSGSLNVQMVTVLEKAQAILQAEMVSRAPTKRIKGAIVSSKPVSPTPGVYQADIVISLKTAPEAGAFEYGSGIHDPRRPGTYVIEPHWPPWFLAFKWDKVNADSPTGPKFWGISKRSGKAIFAYVDHPGVAARPYIRPSIEAKKDEIRQIIGRAFTVEVKSRLGALLRVD